MSKPVPHPLGQRLRALRKAQSITLQALARDLGVHFTTVSAWERGRSEPDYESLGRLAARLGVGAGELLGDAVAGGRPRLRLRVWGAARWDRFRARTEALQVAAATGALCGDRPGLADLIDLVSRYDIDRVEGDSAPVERVVDDDLGARLKHLFPHVRSGVFELLAEWLDLFGPEEEEGTPPANRAGARRGGKMRRGLPPLKAEP
jgi:transcriptional regulator with XRE-family HTH domain